MLLIKDAAAAKSLQSCPTLCDPIDGSSPGSPIPGILQARTLEWVAISFSNAWKWKVKVKSLSRVRLSDPMDCSLPGSSIHGIFQARVLEWGAIAFSTLSHKGNSNQQKKKKKAICQYYKARVLFVGSEKSVWFLCSVVSDWPSCLHLKMPIVVLWILGFSLISQLEKNLPIVRETWILSLG